MPRAALPADRLLRPLLDVSRGEIEAYALAMSGWPGSTKSNGDTAISRNICAIKRWSPQAAFPGGRGALAQAASHFAEAGGLLDELAEIDWQRVAAMATAARLGDLRTLSVLR